MSEKSRPQTTAAPTRIPRSAILSLKPAPGPRPSVERWEEATAVIAVRGELDRDALWAIDFTVGRAAVEAGRIVLDLIEVTHLDYAGVADLVARRKELVQRGGEFSIAVKNPYVTNILKAAGGSELAIFRTVEEASIAHSAVAVVARRSNTSQLGPPRKKGP
jgi:anti-anti-sigma factor